MLSLRTFTIFRRERPDEEESGSYALEYADTGEMISGYVGTASTDIVAIVDGEFGKTFSMHSDEIESTLKEGDRIRDVESSVEYDVRGVMRQSDGPGRFLNATLTLPQEA